MPIAIGTPITSAMNDDITVPNSSAAMPNTGGSACGFQTWVVNRLPLLPVNAGIAFQIRKTAIAAMTTSSRPPEPAARPLKTWSPSRTDLPEMPPSACRPSGVRPPVEIDVTQARLEIADRQRPGHALSG